MREAERGRERGGVGHERGGTLTTTQFTAIETVDQNRWSVTTHNYTSHMHTQGGGVGREGIRTHEQVCTMDFAL
jgi:hypothetical protein